MAHRPTSLSLVFSVMSGREVSATWRQTLVRCGGHLAPERQEFSGRLRTGVSDLLLA